MEYNADNPGGATNHIFKTAGGEKVRIDSDGNIILKDGAAQGNSLVNYIKATDSSGNSQYQYGMLSNGNQDLYIENSKNANIRIRTNGSTRWKIDGDPGHLLPETAGAVNIGSSSAEIGHVYAQNVTLKDPDPSIFFVDSDNNPDYHIVVNSGHFMIKDTTASADRLYINASSTTITNNLNANAGVDVTGEINLTSELNFTGNGHKYVDVATLNGGHSFSIRHQDGSTYETGLTLDANGASKLFHNGIKTFSTDGNGIFAFGPQDGNANVYLYADQGDDNNDKWSIESVAGSSTLTINNRSSGSFVKNIECNGGGNVELYFNGNGPKIETLDTGAKVTGTLELIGGSLKLDSHPLVTTAGFTDISGGSYAARLGSTGSSTIRSTQIYGGGNHIATFDGVNYRLGINVTAPEGRTGSMDIKCTDHTAWNPTSDQRSEASLTLRNSSANTNTFTALHFYNGEGTGTDTTLASVRKANFESDFHVMRRINNAGSGDDNRSSITMRGLGTGPRVIIWAEGTGDNNGDQQCGNHIFESQQQPGFNQYVYWNFKIGSGSYSRAGSLRYHCTWSTGHASGSGYQIGTVLWINDHSATTCDVREHLVYRRRYNNGHHYAWTSNPELEVFQSSNSGQNASIIFRAQGHGDHNSSTWNMATVVHLHIEHMSVAQNSITPRLERFGTSSVSGTGSAVSGDRLGYCTFSDSAPTANTTNF